MSGEDSERDGGSLLVPHVQHLDQTSETFDAFFSPQPLSAQLVRCASTPLGDTGSAFRTLGSIDFDQFDKGKVPRGKDAAKTSTPQTAWEKRDNGSVRILGDNDSGLHETQELHFTFQSRVPDSPPSAAAQSSRPPGIKDRVRLLSEELTYPSDSGFGSDLSAESSRDSPSLADVSRVEAGCLCPRQKKKPKPLASFNLSKCVVPGKYEGIERVDVIFLLSDMGLSHCLESIWKCLSIEDIGRAQQVSAMWRACILSDKFSSTRWLVAKSTFFENLNLNVPNNQQRQKLLKTSPRKAFSCVTNRLASPTSRTRTDAPRDTQQISPGKFRHKLFTEEALTLPPEEQLQQCPRCTLPCRVNLKQSLGTCTMLGCKFSFCTKCLCSPHPNTPCRSSVGSVKSKAVVSSKKSKNRLRRL